MLTRTRTKTTGCFLPSLSLAMLAGLSLGLFFKLGQNYLSKIILNIVDSFDEPNLKATYDFAITIPENFTALSNQPEKESKSLGNNLKTVSFLTTPKMSSYVRLFDDKFCFRN